MTHDDNGVFCVTSSGVGQAMIDRIRQPGWRPSGRIYGEYNADDLIAAKHRQTAERFCAACGKVRVTTHHRVCSGCRCRAAYASGNPRYKCPTCGGYKSNHTHQCLVCYQAVHKKTESPSVP